MDAPRRQHGVLHGSESAGLTPTPHLQPLVGDGQLQYQLRAIV